MTRETETAARAIAAARADGDLDRATALLVEATHDAHGLDAQLLYQHALTLSAQAQFAPARDAFLLLTARLPHGALLWLHAARCSEILGEYEVARTSYRQAITAFTTHPDQPDVARAYFGLGAVLFRLGQPALARQFWEDGLTHPFVSAIARFERSQVLLALGRYAEGWRDYEARRGLSGYQQSITSRVGQQALPPAWDGQAQGTVLCVGGMGAGDVIQFARYLPEVEVRSGHRPTLVAGTPLQGVLGYGGRTNGHDAWCPLDSLPLLLGLDAPIPPPAPVWRDPHNARPRVGVCWQGSSSHTNDKDRSAPIDFRPALQDERWVLVSLQAGHDFAPTDYQATADLMRTLDAIVTVDTSVVHLAGTLGIPTFCIPPTCPEYRWGITDPTSPWYPSVRLIRRPRADDWATAVEHCRRALAQRFSTPTS